MKRQENCGNGATYSHQPQKQIQKLKLDRVMTYHFETPMYVCHYPVQFLFLNLLQGQMCYCILKAQKYHELNLDIFCVHSAYIEKSWNLHF